MTATALGWTARHSDAIGLAASGDYRWRALPDGLPDRALWRRRPPAAIVLLSLLVHSAALVTLLLLSRHAELPTGQTEQTVELLFELAPTAPAPTAEPAPRAASDVISPSSEPERLAVPALAPVAVEPPAPTLLPAVPPVLRQEILSEPVPAPAPVAPAPAVPAVLPPVPPVPMQEFEPSPAMPAVHPIPQQRVAIHETGRPARPLANAALPHISPTAEPPPASANAARAVMSPPIIPPRPVAGMETNRAPAYPEIARRRGEQGNVMLRVNVSADGAPLAVDLAATSGYPSLDAAAQSAVRQWRFVPATQGGVSIAAVAEIPVRFRLDN